MIIVTPALILDGWYVGSWSGHTLQFEYEGVQVQCETDRGVRGINVKVGFDIRDGQVVENSIRPTMEHGASCRLRNSDGSMFVHELRGVVFVTWVAERHKEKAFRFPVSQAERWIRYILDETGIQCLAEPVSL